MKDLFNIILGNEPITNQIAFVFFTLIGMLLIKLWRYNLQLKMLANKTPETTLKFSFKYWLNDNVLDFVCAFLTSFLVYRFLKDVLITSTKYFKIMPSFSDDLFYGLLLGLCFQYLTHKIMNKLKIVS